MDNFNNYFCNIGPNLSKQFNKISTNYKKHLDGNYTNSLFLSEIKSSEVEQITSHLKANKSHGHDEIHPKVIKEVGYKIYSTVLCHIFNQSFKTGIIPNELKISLITPIFKDGKNDEFDNYRPISVLSCFSKILEKPMYKRLIDYIEKK